MYVSTKILLINLLIITISACSNRPILPDRKVEYKRQQVAKKDLEVPPDLTPGTIGNNMPIPQATGLGNSKTYSQYEAIRHNQTGISKTSNVLPKIPNIKVIRDGNQRWLEIQAPPAQVWNTVIDFWQKSGIVLVQKDPALGVMKTDWLENRADIKQNFISDFVRRNLGGIISAGTRDQFRIWIEPGATPNSTYLYLTHRGLEEQMMTSATSSDTQNPYWALRPSDPGLEIEMLRRIMLHFGVKAQAAKSRLVNAQNNQAQPRSRLTKSQNGEVVLLVGANLESAWSLVGIALERVGLTIEDRDRSAGLYYVQYDDPLKEKGQSFFSRLAFWRSTPKKDDSKYRLQLKFTSDAVTQVTVLDSNGQKEKSSTATRILTLVQEQIR